MQLIHGNNKERLKEIPDNSIDSIVTDPPYELGFMGNKWDASGIAYDQGLWRECLRVLKPGGHLLAFSGTRTQHRMVCAIEDAGFEIRDQIGWAYGSGFPKSLDISKAIDKKAGAEREVIATIKKAHFSGSDYDSHEGWSRPSHRNPDGTAKKTMDITAPATEEAKQWQGWGTALKPAWESICVARKPFKGTVAENVLKHGTGGLNIDGCRVGTEERHNPPAHNVDGSGWGMRPNTEGTTAQGRWPANLIHDGSEEATEGLGEAQRFFYCAKASKKDRDEGLERFPEREANYKEYRPNCDNTKGGDTPFAGTNRKGGARNIHTTVKPTALMRYLCRLVTPKGGTVLDPFMGSGSTGKAAILEGFNFIGIELSEEYLEIAKARIEHAQRQKEEKQPDPQLELFKD